MIWYLEHHFPYWKKYVLGIQELETILAWHEVISPQKNKRTHSQCIRTLDQIPLYLETCRNLARAYWIYRFILESNIGCSWIYSAGLDSMILPMSDCQRVPSTYFLFLFSLFRANLHSSKLTKKNKTSTMYRSWSVWKPWVFHWFSTSFGCALLMYPSGQVPVFAGFIAGLSIDPK
jgi:hypothetical protein